ncbi:uncharacterized protein LOC124444291 [Xenia sp. Carnegie-2017]|uniref:uncharacterized protein LOC124444291 n=1 Tax=Xenia sp. Carnegie-2017 TaxID=2897299 RepID=UPI001F042822|nr:uncharacterized protein LOC124444291 [Xenia sp. Carnegie-2017]
MNDSRVSENGLDYEQHNPIPRLLAMDINRFTLSKNLISNVIDIDSGHRGIRQYVAVERPIGTSNNHLNTDCVWKVPSPSRHELPIDNCPSNIIAHYPALPPINLQRSCMPSTNTPNQPSSSSLSLASLEENIAAS